MINEICIFDDIVSKDIQNKIESFVYDEKLIWDDYSNITGGGGYFVNYSFPAKVLPDKRINTEILKLIDVITENVMSKIKEKLLKKYRIKINKTFPHNFDLSNEYKLMHVDRDEQHVVIIYYVNDSDGDTMVYEDVDNKHLGKCGTEIEFDNFKLIKEITPKKGRVAVFNGNLWHYAKYPSKGERNVINMNVVVQNKIKTII